ncbi:hypothetical protein [Saccharolobus islandicus]|nr:hypothetical protein [Sulfolobus islandicus]
MYIGERKMTEQIKLSLRSKQKELLQKFFSIAQKDEVGDLCISMYNSNGKLTLFEQDAQKYQPYAYFRIMRLVEKGIFFIKVKKVKRNKKFLCMHSSIAEKLKSQFES